jgi:class 3 adenylate cyclase
VAARLTDLAGAGEVVASRVVHDLAVGSGLRFEERGRQALKGVPGEWELFAVRGAGSNPPEDTQKKVGRSR